MEIQDAGMRRAGGEITDTLIGRGGELPRLGAARVVSVTLDPDSRAATGSRAPAAGLT